MCIGRLLREHPDAAFVVGTFLILQDAERLSWAQPRWGWKLRLLMETRNEPLPVDEWRQVKYLTAAEIKLEAQRVRYAARATERVATSGHWLRVEHDISENCVQILAVLNNLARRNVQEQRYAVAHARRLLRQVRIDARQCDTRRLLELSSGRAGD